MWPQVILPAFCLVLPFVRRLGIILAFILGTPDLDLRILNKVKHVSRAGMFVQAPPIVHRLLGPHVLPWGPPATVSKRHFSAQGPTSGTIGVLFEQLNPELRTIRRDTPWHVLRSENAVCQNPMLE